IVTDNGSNLQVAKQITNDIYLQIINLWCIAHWFNLISSDLVEILSIKSTLSNA
ncbi:13284_t:CDS:1, partial [Cetraspora pellucida]